MRLFRTIVFLSLLIGVGGPSFAAERPTSGLAISAHFGLFNPIGDFAKKGNSIIDEPAGSAKTGVSPQVMAEYFVTRNVSLGARFGYIWFGQDPGWLQRLAPGIDVDGQWRVHEYGVFVRTIFNPRAKTCIFGRVGIFSGKLQNITGLHAPGARYAELKLEAESAIGYELGMGINEMLSRKLALFGELCYARLNCKDKTATLTFLNDRVEGTLMLNATWVGLRAGLAFFPFE